MNTNHEDLIDNILVFIGGWGVGVGMTLLLTGH